MNIAYLHQGLPTLKKLFCFRERLQQRLPLGVGRGRVVQHSRQIKRTVLEPQLMLLQTTRWLPLEKGSGTERLSEPDTPLARACRRPLPVEVIFAASKDLERCRSQP